MATYRVELTNVNAEVNLEDPNPITGNNDPQLAASQVVNDSSVSGSTVKDALDWLLNNTSITVHNSLTGIQGGSVDQYYHMTLAEHTAATRDATNAVNGLMPAGKLSNWDAAFTHVSSDGSDHSFLDQAVTIASTPTFAGATFTAFPVTPSSPPVNDYDVANKKYVDDNAGGGGTGPNVDYLRFNVAATPPAAVEGQVQWDTENSTLLVTSDKGSANSVGYEDWERVYNLTGSGINNGQPVALNGLITADLRQCFLAEADATGADVNRRNVLGVATHTFASGSDGIVTSRGRVRDIDTTGTPVGESWSVGDELWLSETQGELTNVKPLLPSSQIRIGEVITVNATTGIIDVKVDDLSWVGQTQSGQSSLERTGFVLQDGVAVDVAGNPVVLTIDDGSLLLTVSAPAAFPVYSANNLFYKSGSQSVNWTDVEGDHFFWFDEQGDMIHSTTFDEQAIFGPYIFIAYLYWDATNSRTILSGPLTETHGLQMDGATHYHFHETLGAQVLGAGLSLSDLIVDGDGSLAAHAQFGVESGTVSDEDLRFAISAVTSTTGLPILYLDGTMEYVREISEPNFSVLTDTTAGVGVTGRLVYNEWTGSTWQLTTVGATNFVLCHVFGLGTGGSGDRLYAAVGQEEYLSAALARAGAETEMANLAIKLPFAEVRPIASIIFQTGNYTNAVKARVRPADDGDYVDWRKDAIPGGSGFTASDHNSLSNRSAVNSHPAGAISHSGNPYSIIAGDGSGNLSASTWSINGTLMTAPSGGVIANVTDPTNPQDVATKNYVDSQGSGSHNGLTGIQGGTTDEYYHFTAAQHTGIVGLTTQYTIPVVGASAGVLAESTWLINASTMTTPAESTITAATKVTLTAPDVEIDGTLVTPGITYGEATELTISSGVVTATQALHIIDTEGDAAADDLDSITASTYGGVIYLRPANASRVVTLKDGTGNLELGGADVVMDSIDKWIALTYDSILSKWLIAGGTNGESPTDHNLLNNIQGGTADEYYHMTETEHTAATRDATNVQNGLMPTGKLTNWDAASTHVSSDGSDHTYIDQDVRTTASPTFAGGTFTAFPVTPSQAPTTDYQVANKKYVDDNAGGASPLTTKGDIFTYSTVDARLPVGTDGQVLSADSSEATGLKWIAAGGGGTKDYAYMTMSVSQSSNLTAGNEVEFDQATTNMTYSTTTHRLSLVSGKIYEISWQVLGVFSGDTGQITTNLYNVTGATLLGGIAAGTTSTLSYPVGKYTFTPGSNMDVEIRINVATALTQINLAGSWWMVKEI